MKSKYLIILLLLGVPVVGVFLLFEKAMRPTRLLRAAQNGNTETVAAILMQAKASAPPTVGAERR